MAKMDGVLLGVDLGATYASLALLMASTSGEKPHAKWDRASVEVIANQDGDRQIPACVGFLHPDIVRSIRD
jgi:molecular chaperone DnaK (HSP70)